jgi:hypothetical protein
VIPDILTTGRLLFDMAEKPDYKLFQAVQLNKYLEFQGDPFIHRKDAKIAKV